MYIKKQKLHIIKPDLSASLVDYNLVLNLQFKHYHFMALIMMLGCVVFNNAALALLGGACFSYFLTDTAKAEFMGYGKKLLSSSIILLGFGISLDQAISTGVGGFILTMYSIIFTMVVGLLLAKAFKLEQNTGYLLSCGTAICLWAVDVASRFSGIAVGCFGTVVLAVYQLWCWLRAFVLFVAIATKGSSGQGCLG